jgi:hypothetical protein
MSFLPLVVLGLAAIGAYAKPAVHAPGALDVSLSTPSNKVASTPDLRIVATVKNTGDKDLKILKYGTVLDIEHPTRSFIISKDGKDVPFTGTTVCALAFPTFCVVVNIHAHRFRPPRINSPSPRTTGLSSPPARM